MIVSAIVACAANRVIGLHNQIPWYLSADLKWFKRHTLGHHVIMGRNTFESLGRPLPNRTNIVVTLNPFYAATGCVVVHSVEEGLEFAYANEEQEVFIIGGGSIYRQSLRYWQKLYLTEVDTEIAGDTFFPETTETEWVEVFRESHHPDTKNEFAYTFRILERRNPLE
jgi:dihydrofolate reductase